MKRVFPNQVNLAPACEAEANATAGLLKSAHSEGNRRVYSSVAKIGLAISVGASSILLPGQGNSAVAGDRDTAQSPATLASSSEEKAASPQKASVKYRSDITVEPQEERAYAHRVESGQTLWELAKIYQVEARALADFNSISTDALLQIGQVLYIPSGGDVAPRLESEAQVVLSADLTQKFESQQSLESKNWKQPATLSLNSQASETPLNPTVDSELDQEVVVDLDPIVSPTQQASEAVIQPKKETRLPSPSSSMPPTAIGDSELSVHQVADGETLYSIARKYEISEKDLTNLNQLSDPSYLGVGQQLNIPVRAKKRISPASLSLYGSEVSSNPSEPRSGRPRVVFPRSSVSGPVSVPLVASRTQGDRVAAIPDSALSWAGEGSDETDGNPILLISNAEDEATEEQRLAAKLKTNPNANAHANSSEYIQELRAGIGKLRAKSRIRRESESVVAVEENVIAAASAEQARRSSSNLPLPSSRHINPEFAPEEHIAALETEGLQPWAEPQTQEEVVETPQELTVAAAVRDDEDASDLAVAPLGSSAYAPLKPPQMVSPELPALPDANAYLPKPSGSSPVAPGSGEFNGYTWPAQGVLSSGYGWRWGQMHQGLDIAAPVGTPVVAAAPGVVTYSRWNSGGYGNLVEITHPDGTVTLYGHNNRLLVNEGEEVAQGQQIAEMGSTGYSTGPHVHFELHPRGQGPVDPIAYLAQ